MDAKACLCHTFIEGPLPMWVVARHNIHTYIYSVTFAFVFCGQGTLSAKVRRRFGT